MTLPAVLSVGRLYCDLIFTDLPRLPSMGTEIYAGGFGVHAGGGAYITAAHLGALGHRSALAAMLPAPPMSALLAEDLARAGLDLSLSETMGRTDEPQVTVALVGGGDRAFVTRRSGAAAPGFTAAALTGLGITHVHIGELATLVDCPDLIDRAREAGASLSLDCAWDEGLAADDIAAVLPLVDLFLPNEAEFQHLSDLGLKAECPLTAVKLGADGAMLLNGTTELRVPAEPVDVVDTTGAGDAFNAGFVSAWLAGAGLEDCLQRGTAQAAKAVAVRGGFG